MTDTDTKTSPQQIMAAVEHANQLGAQIAKIPIPEPEIPRINRGWTWR